MTGLKSSTVKLSVPSSVLDDLEELSGLLNYTPSAVASSILKNSLPALIHYTNRVVDEVPVCAPVLRYRGASAEWLDSYFDGLVSIKGGDYEYTASPYTYC